MRQIVMCCDGTWNTPDLESDGVPTPTNVYKLYNSLAERDAGGNEQIRYYHPGVGTDGGLLDRLSGGGLGTGLSRNIQHAYAWLAHHYEPGDQVTFVGFSRGAYTVRSLAGMLYACGLIRFADGLNLLERLEQVARIYDNGYRPGKDRDPDWRDGLAFRDGFEVRFLGVWDTVGSLGVPDHLGPLTLLDPPGRYAFHDTKLTPLIRHARHAVAIDETRGPFSPTLWDTRDADLSGGRSVLQLWFPGNHGDVGGGHPECGLADGALRWMIDESVRCAGLAYRPEMLAQITPNPKCVLHDDCTGVYRLLGPAPRPAPPIEPGAGEEDAVHHSAVRRQAAPPIAVGVYRPTTVLRPGETETVTVQADEPWNATGLYLHPGDYEFAATGEWLDRSILTGPDGASDGVFDIAELTHLLGNLRGLWRQLVSRVLRDERTESLGARRVEGIAWMALIGVVADAALDEQTGITLPYEPIVLGSERRVSVPRSGYLYAFANDAWGFYGNNNGHLSLSVTMVG